MTALSGFSHPRCYANGDNDCSATISSEHYISETLLKRIELNKLSKVAGLSWQEPEQFSLVATKGLAANILCTAHNSRLSGLDDLIGKFADDVRDTDRGQFKPGKPIRVSGSDLERWMLKSLLGVTISKNLPSHMKPVCLDLLFNRTAWPDQWGLYFDTHREKIYHTDSILIETITDMDNLILGAKFFIQGLPLTLIMGRPGDSAVWGIWRPARIIFQVPSGERKLIIRWNAPGSGKTLTLSRIGAYDGHPPDWKEWEKND